MKHEIITLKEQLKQTKLALCEKFAHMQHITHITAQLTQAVDHILIKLFNERRLHHNGDFCLLALGSYGRRELQLFSDIDILLLHQDTASQSALARAQKFIQDCWDVGLAISHQITTIT
jgi:[protein-PII] uridylyltransferase